MGKFDNAKVSKGIAEIAKKSNDQGNVLSLVYIKDEQLLDYKENNEDITMTEDLEMSMEEQGFTDPIEVTDFGCEEGLYTIVSGHRRRAAGRKRNMKEFPCIIRHFKSDAEVHNYVLFSNAHRETTIWVLANRAAMHSVYLKKANFKGNVSEEIGKRMNLKRASVDRYLALNKIIEVFRTLEEDEKIGMSALTDSGLYTHTAEEQKEIYEIVVEAINGGVDITRTLMSKIVKGYRAGSRTWNEIEEINKPIPMPIPTPTPNPTPAPLPHDAGEDSSLRNEEIDYDTSHREMQSDDVEEYKEVPSKDSQDERDKEELTDEQKKDRDKKQKGEAIATKMEQLETLLTDLYSVEEGQKENMMGNMSALIKVLLAEIDGLAGDKYTECAKKLMNDISEDIKKNYSDY